MQALFLKSYTKRRLPYHIVILITTFLLLILISNSSNPSPSLSKTGQILSESTQIAHSRSLVATHLSASNRPTVHLARKEALTVTGMGSDDTDHQQHLLVELLNTGTVLLQPLGHLEIFDLNGNLLQNIPLKPDALQPLKALDYSITLPHALLPGQYRTSLSLAYGHDHMLLYSALFAVPPAVVSDNGLLSAELVKFLSQQAPWQDALGILIGLLLLNGLRACFAHCRSCLKSKFCLLSEKRRKKLV